MLFTAITLLTTLFTLVLGIHPPTIRNLSISWSDDFTGCQGCSPSSHDWATALRAGNNHEVQSYTSESENIQLSGGHTLQIVPWKSSSGAWTSGRIETREAFTPQPGKVMRVQAGLRMGENANKQGMWPAFWMLGDAMRHGTTWPLCGEIDVMEQINGVMTGYGTVHCGDAVCDEPKGLVGHAVIPDDDFHNWAVVIDRTSGDWKTETISWYMDDDAFHVLKGSEVGDEGVWATIAHSPMYILLNVAVGGVWPGSPDDKTDDGYGSMMEVQYVAVYESA